MQDLEMNRRATKCDEAQVPGTEKNIGQSMTKRVLVALILPGFGVAAPLLPQRAKRSDIPRQGSREQHIENILITKQGCQMQKLEASRKQKRSDATGPKASIN
jgi:hypothetical protein